MSRFVPFHSKKVRLSNIWLLLENFAHFIITIFDRTEKNINYIILTQTVQVRCGCVRVSVVVAVVVVVVESI